MVQLQSWLELDYVLLYGNDGDGRREVVQLWRSAHINPDWEAFSVTECSENCSWSEIFHALQELAPMAMERIVIVPKADHLLIKDLAIPVAVNKVLQTPLANTKLLLVVGDSITNNHSTFLSSKIFSDWQQQGRILKVDSLNSKNIISWIENCARSMNLQLDTEAAKLLAKQIGNNAGILRRALETLDLICSNRVVSLENIESAVFCLGEYDTFAWTKAWQSGSIYLSLKALQQDFAEYSLSERYLMLLSQARREVERLCCLIDAQRLGVIDKTSLMAASELSTRQEFLLPTYLRVASRIGLSGAHRLLKLINNIEQDIKGCAVTRSITPLMHLTVALCRAWSG